ncbi:MAG: hypothetical protein ACI9OJ_000442 [Myxococcota bacterium]|jgi:hypothetical protein
MSPRPALLGALLASLLLVACSDDAADPKQERPPARRMAAVDGPTLARKANVLQTGACACLDAKCAAQMLVNIEAFGRKYVAVELATGPTGEIIASVDAALICLAKYPPE